MGYSEALWFSLKKHQPDANFYTVLCDLPENFDRFAFPYPIITIDDLGISNVENMKEKYNITEFNTSLKPFAFSYIFDNHPGKTVLYLDPDILITSRMEELHHLFSEGANCVLTPHITGSAEYADISEYHFVKYGIYNLGFCALRDTSQTRRVVAWWGRRLENDCVIDFARGIFVDQKWADYFPAFIEKTVVLQHPGYNLAYWNLSQRKLEKIGNHWQSNRQPLRFFHFSGNKIEDENVFTRHSGQFNLNNTPILSDILEEYRNCIIRGGHKYYSGFQYAFSWNGSSGFNEHTPETFRRLVQADAVPHLPLLRSRTPAAYEADRAHNRLALGMRETIEARADSTKPEAYHEGYCVWCRAERSFKYKHASLPLRSDPGPVSFSLPTHLRCVSCGSSSRTRGNLSILQQEVSAGFDGPVYITEQSTLLFERLKGQWPSIVGSEFVSSELESGAEVNGIRHEDLEALSFAEKTFHLILSYDVLHRISDPLIAFRELYRCLAPGGIIHFTANFYSMTQFERGNHRILIGNLAILLLI